MSDTLSFNDLLTKTSLPLNEIKLVRHVERGARRNTPYSLWVEDPDKFLIYQSIQDIKRQANFNAPYWASFVTTPSDETLFVGIYSANLHGNLNERNCFCPLRERNFSQSEFENINFYNCKITSHLNQYIGRLIIDWGPGTRSWVQNANSYAGNSKTIVEIKKQFSEPKFPGFHKFISLLSGLQTTPITWQTALKSVKGIYLLTCPKTKEQYVGKASGHEGFWGRWMEYFHTGHGGNVGLKTRDPSDYQISILEVCSPNILEDDINKLETLWKNKLQSREMGLNRN